MSLAPESPRVHVLDASSSSSVQALLESLDDDVSCCCDLLLLDDSDSDSDIGAGEPGCQVLFQSATSPLPAANECRAGASPASSQQIDLPRRRNSYRERVKLEIRFLRARSAELAEHLAVLQTGGAVLSASDRQRVGSWWKRLALSQQRGRRESETENVRLKRALRSQQEMSANLQRELARRLDPAFVTARDTTPRLKHARAATMRDDGSFAELAGGLDAAFARFDAVMEDCAMADGQGGIALRCRMKTTVAATGEVTPFMELTNATVSPFGPREMSKAVWRSLVEQFFHRSSSRVESAWRSGNTVAAHVRSKYVVQKHARGGDDEQQPSQRREQKEVLNFKIVLRKFIDDESRMVLVWRARNEGEGDLADVYADETGWALVQPAPSAAASRTVPCIARTCVHLVQRHRVTQSVVDASTQPPLPSASALADLVVSSNVNDISAIVDTVERLLLAQVRAGGAQAEAQ